jgi:hypothetical protein
MVMDLIFTSIMYKYILFTTGLESSAGTYILTTSTAYP